MQDLVPYLQDGCSWDEIIRWIPALSREEIAVVEQYYREHKETLDEEDGRIREQNAQRKDPPDVQKLREEGKARMQALREQLLRTKANGESR